MSGRLELERIVADFLGSDINTRLATVPVDVGDSQPPPIAAYAATGIGSDTLTPNNLAIFDSTRHIVVVDKKVGPPALPALYVSSQGPIMMMGEPYPAGQIRATEVPVKIVVRYITSNSDFAVARRDGSYTLRAVARSLRALSKSYNGPGYSGIRNGILLVLGQGPMEFWPTVDSVGNARVAGAIVVHYYVRDLNPEF